MTRYLSACGGQQGARATLDSGDLWDQITHEGKVRSSRFFLTKWTSTLLRRVVRRIEEMAFYAGRGDRRSIISQLATPS